MAVNEKIGKLTCLINSVKEHIVLLRQLRLDTLCVEVYLEMLEDSLTKEKAKQDN